MRKFRGKFEKLHEQTLHRFQQGGFLAGDYVKIKSDAFSDDYVKKMSDQMKAMIKEAMKYEGNLKIAYIKTAHAEAPSGPVGAANVPGCMWADVVFEYAPGMWKDPMTLPLNILDKVIIESEEEDSTPIQSGKAASAYPPVPDGIKRPNNIIYKPEEVESTNNREDEQKDTHNLPKKNTKLAHTKEPKSGLSQVNASYKHIKKDVELMNEAYLQVQRNKKTLTEVESPEIYDTGEFVTHDVETVSPEEAYQLALDSSEPIVFVGNPETLPDAFLSRVIVNPPADQQAAIYQRVLDMGEPLKILFSPGETDKLKGGLGARVKVYMIEDIPAQINASYKHIKKDVELMNEAYLRIQQNNKKLLSEDTAGMVFITPEVGNKSWSEPGSMNVRPIDPEEAAEIQSEPSLYKDPKSSAIVDMSDEGIGVFISSDKVEQGKALAKFLNELPEEEWNDYDESMVERIISSAFQRILHSRQF